MDDSDERLSSSSPAITPRERIGAELATLAHSTQALVRRPRRPQLARVGIPVLVGLLLLGGGTAAFASPVVRQSLGISAPTPTPSAAAVTHLTAPYPNCRVITTLVNGHTSPLNKPGKNARKLARAYLDEIDQGAILRSKEFRTMYTAFVGPMIHPIPTAIPADLVTELETSNTQARAYGERVVLGQIINQRLSDYLEAQVHAGRDVDPGAVGTTGKSIGCGEN